MLRAHKAFADTAFQHGDKGLAGKMLGISRATLYRKLKRYNLLKSSAASA